jgi:2-polyprenyl-3-methyl-5-hydroxy-6-metoxy-1,4-benzoquinol methylase
MNRQQRRKMKRTGESDVPHQKSRQGISSVHHLLPVALQHIEAGRLSQAIETYQHILAAEPRHTASLYNLAVIAFRIGNLDDAVGLSRQTLAIDPKHADAHGHLAAALAGQGKLVEAAEHGEKAVELNRKHLRAYKTLASIYAAGRDMPRALYAIMRGLKIQETPQLKLMFVQYVKEATSTVPEGPEFREHLVRALSEPWGRPNVIAHTCTQLVRHDPRINDAIRRAAHAWPKRLPFSELFGADGFSAVSNDSLLRALLENGRLPDVATECFLTMTRTEMLEIAASARREMLSDPAALNFFCALARQCFINEYVFAETDAERTVVARLRDELASALRSNGNVDPLKLVAIAAYEPLHKMPDCESFLLRSWPDAVDALLTQQVREPVAERNMRASMPRLTEIDDGVSVLVQQQYEENPYPRWVKTVAEPNPGTIDQNLKAKYPNGYRPIGKKNIDTLIAGCGTGQQVVDLATSLPDARVLAVDLSLTSLCYAKNRTDAMGLTNIDYGQADILKLGALGRRFDVVASTGVLHHLRDPLEGWRTLLALLRPNGLMQIALYSEIARASVVAARSFIAEKGYGVSAEDIRRCRQDIMRLDVRSPISAVARSTDFFGTSDCRDLLFHVQEHRFTIPQIKKFLEENGLRFLGFFTADPLLREYPNMFPDDVARNNLTNWHEFEMRNPMAFASMYQFWVQKAD